MRKLVRWLPAIVAPVVIAAAAVTIPAVANADSPLPPKTAQQVLALVAKSESAAFTGTVEQSSDLGLPDLSELGGAGGSDSGSSLTDLLTAAHTAKVYADGPTRQRLQVLDQLAETDVIRNGRSLWAYDSSDDSATHLVAPAGARQLSGSPAVTPPAAAAQLVAALRPDTTLSVSSDSRVAGRAAYRLTLTPKTTATLIGAVTVAVDAQTGVPLEVTVDARGQAKPAETIAFTSISYGAPAASVFAFTPPQGAKVTVKTLGPSQHPASTGVEPTVIGAGWTSIAELPAGSLTLDSSSSDSGSSDDTALLDELTSPVADGRALQTSLLSVLITDDGRVLVGAVPVASLEAAAR